MDGLFVSPGSKINRDSECLESLKQKVRNGGTVKEVVAELHKRGCTLSNSVRSILSSVESHSRLAIQERLRAFSLDALCAYQPTNEIERQVRDWVYYERELARRRSVPRLQTLIASALDWQLPLIDRRIVRIEQRQKERREAQRRRDRRKALLEKVHNGELKSRTAWAKAGRVVIDGSEARGEIEGRWATWPLFSFDQTVPKPERKSDPEAGNDGPEFDVVGA